MSRDESPVAYTEAKKPKMRFSVQINEVANGFIIDLMGRSFVIQGSGVDDDFEQMVNTLRMLYTEMK